MIVVFCGHSGFNESEKYEQTLLKILNDTVGENPVEMYLGGYGLFDEFANQCAKKYKATHPNVSLIYVTPYITSEYCRNHLKLKKAQYDSIIYPDIEKVPLKYAVLYRNRYMINNADYVIAYVKRAFGGAYQSLKFARSKIKL